MWFDSLLASWKSGLTGRRDPQPLRRGRRPNLELLEDRTVPSGSYVFTTIDNPNGNGGFNSANGINARGDIVGNYLDANFAEHGFLLSHGRYTTLDDPNGVDGTTATDLNDSGTIVGVYFGPSENGFILRRGQYTAIDDGVYGTGAFGINDSDMIVGVYFDANSMEHGFLLSHGQYTTIDDPNGVYGTVPSGINNRGQIVGEYIDANTRPNGFLLSCGQYTTIDDPNAVYGTFATGINNRGQIVGYYLDANVVQHGFLLSHGQYTTIDDPNGAQGTGQGTLANGISDSGKIVGNYFDALGNSHAFLATKAHDDDLLAVAGPAAGRINKGAHLSLPAAALDIAKLTPNGAFTVAAGSGDNRGNGFAGIATSQTGAFTGVPSTRQGGEDIVSRRLCVGSTAAVTAGEGAGPIADDFFVQQDNLFGLGFPSFRDSMA